MSSTQKTSSHRTQGVEKVAHLLCYSNMREEKGATLLACEDLSTNGLLLNENLIKRNSVILMHNDVIKIPRSEAFKCVYARPSSIFQRKTLFDPTPSSVPVDKQVGNYTVTSLTLGSGSYATVNLAYTLKSTISSPLMMYQQAACKMIKLGGRPQIDNLMREVELLRGLDHPNINRVLDVVFSDDFINLFLELSTGGDLFTYITTRDNEKIPEREAKYCSFQLMLGLQYLHNRNISHRGFLRRRDVQLDTDLKPENVLLHTPGPYPRLMIADFGLARPRAYEETLNAVGTICYMPPEAILALQTKSHGYVGIYADAWSLDTHTTLKSLSRKTNSNSNRYDSLTMCRILASPLKLDDDIWRNMPEGCYRIKETRTWTVAAKAETKRHNPRRASE
ncbi:hypothetical protein Clacol_004031 [Clathrus columnatus]|uniref:non-specific serine/threonine protein kinase n=1 Tax=Clathrus columnatus TaxID=1419009 RepID=A0AAV5A8G8_9AGAM|nr:hypothetical protein Clacol_004031 [Clathrus columnatus]